MVRHGHRPHTYGTSNDEENLGVDTVSATPSDRILIGRQEKVKIIRNFLWNSLLYILGSSLVALFLVSFKSNDITTNSASITSSIYSDRAPTGVLPNGIYAKTQDLGVVATNEYGQFTQKSYYQWMNDVPGSQLVEPYKETALTIVGSYVNSGGYAYTWTIYNFDDSGVDWTKEGKFQTTQKLTFTKPGLYSIQIDAKDSTTGELKLSYSTTLICKYVKREIRTLTTDDRERFLDAAKKLWEVNSNKGIQLYGSQYTSIDKLVAVHSLASNDVMCDGFHEGSGFLTHHLALTNTFEAALRSVDPSVTLPYWDFTIEGQAIALASEKPSYMLELSPIFTTEWFGSIDEQYRIRDSRWKNIEMPKQKENNGVQNSYGYIRSYWNNNNDTRKLYSSTLT